MTETQFFLCWVLGWVGYSIIMNVLSVTRDLVSYFFDYLKIFIK